MMTRAVAGCGLRVASEDKTGLLGSRRSPLAAHHRGRGFTLIELLVVIFIILLVSAVALPTVLPAFNHRQVSEAGRILQGALVGARDSAIHKNQAGGIRLLPDPTYPITWTQTNTINPFTILAYNRIIPIETAPEYSEGFCMPFIPGPTGSTAYLASIGVTLTNVPPSTVPVTPTGQPAGLVLLENPFNPKTGAPNPPTSWFWNIRVGDKVQLNNAGPWYTVIGPMLVGPNNNSGSNSEMFVNVGLPAPLSQYSNVLPSLLFQGQTQPVEYLLLVNGQDDNKNGWVDEGQDGVDNNGVFGVDDISEWELESWLGSVTTHTSIDIPYTIQRRPAPAPNAREVALPTSVVVDATTTFLTQERSRLPVNRYTGYADIVINPDGTVLPTVQYSSPSSIGMAGSFYHFWLSERQDLVDVQADANGNALPLTTGAPYLLPITQPGGSNPGGFPGPYLKGEYSLLTLFTRTGQIASNQGVPFLYDSTIGYNSQTGTYNPSNPFIQAEQGLSGGR